MGFLVSVQESSIPRMFEKTKTCLGPASFQRFDVCGIAELSLGRMGLNLITLDLKDARLSG